MRKIEKQLKEAFFAGKNLKVSNSEVQVVNYKMSIPGEEQEVDATLVYLKLFDSVIACRNANNDGDNRINITLAGYNTTTTRSRLSNVIGACVCQRRGVAKFYSPTKVVPYLPMETDKSYIFSPENNTLTPA